MLFSAMGRPCICSFERPVERYTSYVCFGLALALIAIAGKAAFGFKLLTTHRSLELSSSIDIALRVANSLESLVRSRYRTRPEKFKVLSAKLLDSIVSFGDPWR